MYELAKKSLLGENEVKIKKVSGTQCGIVVVLTGGQHGSVVVIIIVI